jgi:nitrite reductase (NADH) small subunit
MLDGEWTRLLPVAECAPGKGRFICIAGQELAVFRLIDPERFFVIRNSCPHAGGNLASGEVAGTVVTCPWHQWPFDLATGACTLSPTARLRRFECRVEDGFVWALLPAG